MISVTHLHFDCLAEQFKVCLSSSEQRIQKLNTDLGTSSFWPAPQIVIICCYCCHQAQQPVLFCKHSSAPEKSVQHLCNIIVITQIVCTFLLNGGMTETNQPALRLCYCFHYTHLGPLCPLSRGQDFFCNLQGT